ncbi:MAG TPA: ADOP family duplicated permease [Gemmatimonadaceae bacterium]|nr:ADOP family duplicated permease [Gemmatimonadaceae bacterium]
MDIPRTINELRAAAHNLLHRRDADDTLDEEVRAYVDLLTAEKVRAGVPHADARRAALIECGGVDRVKDEVRDTWAGARIESWRRDVVHTLRGLRRTPGFTIAVVASLAIGIGLNSALFTLIYSVLMRPLPLRDASRVVNVYQRLLSGGPNGRDVNGNPSFLSYDEYLAYAKAPSLASSAAYHPVELSVTDGAGRAAAGEIVSCGYFRALRVSMALGRDFTADECGHVGGTASVVLSFAAWQSHYGGDSSIVRRIVQLNGIPCRIIGVSERGFDGISLQRASLWLPVTMQPALDHGRDSILVHPNASWLMMVARLAPGVTLAQANAEATVIGRRLDAALPGRRTIPTVVRGAYFNFPEVATQGVIPIALTMLLGFTIVGMACANVMSLVLARGLARRREIAIRLALGASRAQLVRQLVIESSVLSLAGAAIGMAFVYSLPIVLAALSPLANMQLNASPDQRVAAYVFVVAAVATLLIGLAPALQATSVDLASAFKGSSTAGRMRLRPSRLRGIVVGVQMAGSAMLLGVAGLFLRGTLHAVSADPGYVTRNVVAFSTNASAIGYDSARSTAAYNAIVSRIRATPGVASVALADRMPLLSSSTGSFYVERGRDSLRYGANIAVVSGTYFNALGMRILRGATFDSLNATRDDSPVVISASLAERLWPGEDALGRRIKWGARWRRVIGVSSNSAVTSLAEPAAPIVYFPAVAPLGKQIVVRTSNSPAALIAAVPAWAREFDPQLSVESQRFEDRIALALLPGRLVVVSTGVLGALALLLAAIGVAGVVGFAVGQRRHELAVRLAIGATARDVVALMMRQGARPLIIGGAVGVAIAGVLARLVRGLLYGTSPLDPVAYATILATLALTGLVATYVPSRRAAHIDPSATLRNEA